MPAPKDPVKYSLWIQRLKKAHTGHVTSSETKEKIRNGNLGKIRTAEQNKNNSESHKGLQKGEKNGMYGKHRTKEDMQKALEGTRRYWAEQNIHPSEKELQRRIRQSEYMKSKNNPMKKPEIAKKLGNLMKNKPKSKEHCRHLSESHSGPNNPIYGLYGNKNPAYKGGQKMADARHTAKRRRLGNIFINNDFEGSTGHHIDQNHILYVPKWLHEKIKHSVFDPYKYNKGLIRMNIAAWMWYLFDTKTNLDGETK